MYIIYSNYLIHINDLSDIITSSPKLLPENTSSFFIVHDVNLSGNYFYNDLIQINKWSWQWKMNVNPNPSKQVQDVQLHSTFFLACLYFSVKLRFNYISLAQYLCFLKVGS